LARGHKWRVANPKVLKQELGPAEYATPKKEASERP